MNPFAPYHMQMFSTFLQLRRVVSWMVDTVEDMPPAAQTYLAAYMTMIAIYMNTSARILEAPTVVRPIVGRRCIFY